MLTNQMNETIEINFYKDTRCIHAIKRERNHLKNISDMRHEKYSKKKI